MTRTKRNPNPPDQDPEVQQLKIDWPTLKDPYIKGDRLLPLRARFSLAQLAAEFGISTKRVRDLLELASVRGTEREDAKKLGVKTVLATLRKNRKTIRRWEKQTTGQSGRKLKNRLAKQLRDWLVQNLAEPMWDPFFQMVFNEACYCSDLREKFAPRTFDELQFDGDWQKVIAVTQPPGRPLVGYDTFFDYYLQWFYCWILRCMPFPAICESVSRRVREDLRRTARRRFGSTVAWTFSPPAK